jgi:ElaB/YqjD/DUF883 family membrane-anchored ribosome-binding protein
MATSLLHTIRRRRNGALHDIEASVEDQIESLREEIAALTKAIAKSGASQKIRYQAQAGYDDLVNRSEDLLQEIQDGYLRGAREMRETVRRHPVATIGAAAAFGVVLALLARR